jgi:CubicO group peptidase (beta-lactamase class C family)
VARIGQLLGRYHDYGQFNGAVLVARQGRAIYRGAFGLANRELSVSNSIDTRFAVASINKTITAILALRLIERGKIHLDGTVRDYLADYPGDTGAIITIRQLLTHTSGLQGDIMDFPTSGHDFPPVITQLNGDFFTLQEMIPMIARRPLLFPPGTRYSYSSDGYTLLGAIVARVYGKSYEVALQEDILERLGMRDSGYVPQMTIVPHRASGYDQTFAGYENARPMGISPSGGMFSTVGDLLLLDQALLGDRLLGAESKKLAWGPSPYITAYGWKVRKDAGAPKNDALRVQASGAQPGFNALFTRTLMDGLCVILLVNTRDITFRLDEITNGLIDILRDRTPVEPRQSVALTLAQTIQQRGIAQALNDYQSMRTGSFSGSYLSETEINSLGYYLLNQHRAKDAIAILALNAEAFPNSANVFDSLAEANMLLGDREAAIRNYQKSLELDPKNNNARTNLDKLRNGKK